MKTPAAEIYKNIVPKPNYNDMVKTCLPAMKNRVPNMKYKGKAWEDGVIPAS